MSVEGELLSFTPIFVLCVLLIGVCVEKYGKVCEKVIEYPQ